jgi:predicted phosphoribosyltransferase
MDKYADRYEAGVILADILKEYANKPDTIILALPRGGVPIAYEIAKELNLPLDVFIVRKLGVPGYEELAMGAIASGGTIDFNKNVLSSLNIEQSAMKHVIESEQKELTRREHVYRGERPFPDLKNKTIILVDDGIATGSTMRAAISALRKQNPTSIVVAIPVAAWSSCQELKTVADKIVCPLRPIQFNAVGMWYDLFDQTSDAEVIELLKIASERHI